MGLRFVDKLLNRAFYKLGLVVGHHPGYFIIVPVLLTFLCATGYQQLHNNIDPEYLFSPVNGPGKTERRIVEEAFRVNYTDRFNVARITRAGIRNILNSRYCVSVVGILRISVFQKQEIVLYLFVATTLTIMSKATLDDRVSILFQLDAFVL